MLKYTIKRLLESLVTVLIIVTIVFLLLRLLPTATLSVWTSANPDVFRTVYRLLK